MSALVIDEAGWCHGAWRVDSPNFSAREPTGIEPSLVVIHAISLPPREFGGSEIDALFTNQLSAHAHPYFAPISRLRVSAHFVIARDGHLTQYVSCLACAWHAGVSSWRGVEKCNNFSVGIELEGCDELPFEDAQYATLVPLLSALSSRYPSLCHAAAHSEIAPGRKTDPGPCFDWQKIPQPWRAWISGSEPHHMG